ncbi:cytochrome C assembly protein, partial [Paenibacillus sp. MCAF20]
MVTQNVLYDAILYVYALSLLFYFSDFMNASRKAKRIGTG